MATSYNMSTCPVLKKTNMSAIVVTSPYGYRTHPTKGTREFHKGIDLQVTPGKTGDVIAIAGGKVVAVQKNCTGYSTSMSAGNYVFLDHGNGIVTKYMHMKYKSVTLNVGDKVGVGTKLGYMGTTGQSTGEHLHFQIEVNGNTVDPLPFVLGKKELTAASEYQNIVTESKWNKWDPAVGAGYQPSTDDVFATVNSAVADSNFVKIKNVAGVFGLPYQFLPNADIRLDGSKVTENIGYEYGERIIEQIPLLFLAPGKANFMTKYSTKNKENIMEKLLTIAGGNDNKTSLSDLLDSDGRYYTFEYDTTTYYKFVNPMCRIAARYLGIQDVRVNGTKLDNFNWASFTKSGISSIGDFGTYTAIPFYLDTDTSINESFGNSTSQSMLASTVNGVSDTAKELNFLLGYGAGGKNIGEAIEADGALTNSINNVADMASKLLGSGGFFSNLGDHLKTVASGGKLIFPEIWGDSSFSRSYNVKLKFVSPDPSNLSIYMNVLVPLFHLICLVAPQMPENNPNGYINPFLIRGIYKGFFNIDMGIITDMSVTKGGECQWTVEGIPTSIEVDLSIKDLYNAMTITATDSLNWKYDTLNNTALMDYIANLCGINIYKPEITRIIDMWYTNNFTNRLTDFFRVNMWGGIQQKVQNLIMGIYR